MDQNYWPDGVSMDTEQLPKYNDSTPLGFIFNTSSSVLGSLLPCEGLSPPQHHLFNLANACFLLSYLAPSNPRGLLFMHSILILGFLLFSTWAWNVICAPDVFSWNFTFVLLNMGQTLYILYQMRPVRIRNELEPLYTNLFEPLQVPRSMFKRLVSSEYAQTMSLHAGEAYALYNLTKTDRLGLLIEGRASVLSPNHYLHSVSPMEFLDSPEFESCRTSVEDKFKVSVVAVTSCRYVYWQRSSLEFFFVREPYISTVMSALIARDITSKLYSMNHKIVTEKGSQLDIRLPSLTSSLSSSIGDNLSHKSPGRSRNISHRKASSLSLAVSLPGIENRSQLSLKASPDISRLRNGSKQRTPYSPSLACRQSGVLKLQNGFSRGIRPLRYPCSNSIESPFGSEQGLNEEEEEENSETLLD